MKHPLLHIVHCAAAVALVVSFSLGKTIRVPEDRATIKEAIDAAVNGDTILVAEGTYQENLVISKRITLASLFFLDSDTSHISRTILDGSNPWHPDTGSVILVTQGSDTTTLITGFTIQNGTGTNGISLSDGTLLNAGGGICCNGGGARIEYNIITNNVVEKNLPAGGGVWVGGATPYFIVHSNIIRGNHSASQTWAEGGGISTAASGEISNNTIVRNTAGNGPCGGLIIWGPTAIVKVINNTIALNSASGGTEGVGLNEGTIYLMNNIFWNPGDGPEIYGDLETLFASNNLIRGDYYGDNHFSANPLFADTVAFNLSSLSPAMSAGAMLKTMNGTIVAAPSKDVYGNPRPQSVGTPPDLGAVESPSAVPVPSPWDPQLTNRTMAVDGLLRQYLLFTPKHYASQSRLPLLVFFHGAGWTGELSISHGFNDIADKEGFIAVYPESYTRPQRNWDVSSSTTNDMKFANQLIDTLIARFRVDSTRIFLVGYSNGATMTFWYTSFYGLRVRAIAPFAHLLSTSITSIAKPIPMIYFMGTADPIVNYNGYSGRWSAETSAAIWAGFNNCQTTPIVEDLPNSVSTDNSSVTRISYPKAGNATAPVQFYKVAGGGHSLPGPQMFYNGPVNRDINGPELIWRFFKNVSGMTDVSEGSLVVPDKASLSQNYPNPFNPSTTIKYELPKPVQVRLSVYDMLGREVSVLVNERREAGVHEVKFDGLDLASGVYFYRLQAGEFVETRQLLLLR